MVHKMRDLPPEARGVVESLIGRRLTDEEVFSIRPMRIQREGAGVTAALEAADRFEEYFEEIDRQHPPLPAGQVEEVIVQTMRQVRPGYKPAVENHA